MDCGASNILGRKLEDISIDDQETDREGVGENDMENREIERSSERASKQEHHYPHRVTEKRYTTLLSSAVPDRWCQTIASGEQETYQDQKGDKRRCCKPT